MALRADVDRAFDFLKDRNYEQIEAEPRFRDILVDLLISIGCSELESEIMVVEKGSRRVVKKTFKNYGTPIDRLKELAEENRRQLLKLWK